MIDPNNPPANPKMVGSTSTNQHGQPDKASHPTQVAVSGKATVKSPLSRHNRLKSIWTPTPKMQSKKPMAHPTKPKVKTA